MVLPVSQHRELPAECAQARGWTGRSGSSFRVVGQIGIPEGVGLCQRVRAGRVVVVVVRGCVEVTGWLCWVVGFRTRVRRSDERQASDTAVPR